MKQVLLHEFPPDMVIPEFDAGYGKWRLVHDYRTPFHIGCAEDALEVIVRGRGRDTAFAGELSKGHAGMLRKEHEHPLLRLIERNMRKGALGEREEAVPEAGGVPGLPVNQILIELLPEPVRPL